MTGTRVRRKNTGTGGGKPGYIDPALREVRTPNSFYLWTLAEDGEWRVDVPTHAELIKHAERYGTEQVAETAVVLGYDLERLVALITRLDLIDQVIRSKDHHTIKRGTVSKRSPEVRAKKLLNWEEPTEEDV